MLHHTTTRVLVALGLVTALAVVAVPTATAQSPVPEFCYQLEGGNWYHQELEVCSDGSFWVWFCANFPSNVPYHTVLNQLVCVFLHD